MIIDIYEIRFVITKTIFVKSVPRKYILPKVFKWEGIS